MSGKSTIKVTGAFATIDVPSTVDALTEGVLRGAGETGVVLMRKNMHHKDYSETDGTRKSVMWRAKFDTGKIETKYDLAPPISKDRVFIGSAAPNSTYIEYGTLGHSSATDSDEFVKEVTAWALSKGVPPDEIFPIIRSIREHGTRAFPYAQQTTADLNSIARKLGQEYIAQFTQKLNYKNGAMFSRWNTEVTE